MHETPIVSICCATYNHRDFVSDALSGFLMQKTDFQVEILIHDDASTDGTVGVLKEYDENNPSIITTIYQDQNVYSHGVNPYISYLFPRSRGKYIAICEGDDYWTDSCKLQRQVDFLERNPRYSMCVHNAIIHYENGERPDAYFNLKDQKSEISTEDLISQWSFATASIVCRRSMMREFEESTQHAKVYNGDLFLALMLSIKGPIKYLPEAMSTYRRSDLGRYDGMEIKILTKRIELLQQFDVISDGRFHELITNRVREFQKSINLQRLYTRLPLVKKLYRGLKSVIKA